MPNLKNKLFNKLGHRAVRVIVLLTMVATVFMIKPEPTQAVIYYGPGIYYGNHPGWSGGYSYGVYRTSNPYLHGASFPAYFYFCGTSARFYYHRVNAQASDNTWSWYSDMGHSGSAYNYYYGDTQAYWSNTFYFPQGNHYIYIGNVAQLYYLEIGGTCDDSSPPTLTATPSTTGWTKNNVSYSLSAADASGVNYHQWGFTPDSTGTFSGWSNCGSNPCNASVTENGTLSYRAYDNHAIGKQENYTVSNIDKTPPSTAGNPSYNAASWTNQDVLVTIGEGVDAGSGVSNVFCKRREVGTYNEGSGGQCQVYASNEDQIIDYYTVDLAGNQTTGSLTVTNIDKTPPSSGSANQNVSTWTSGNVLVTTYIGSDTKSGVSNIFCKKREDGDYTSGSGGQCQTTAVEEDQIIDYYTVDNAGNIASGSYTVQYIDKTPPTAGTPSRDISAWTSGNVTVTVTKGNDGESGVSNVWCKKREDGSYTAGSGGVCNVTASNENQIVDYYTVDNVGNQTTGSFTVTNIDKTPPTAGTPSRDISAWTSGNVTVTVTKGADSESGVSNVWCKKREEGSYAPGSGGVCNVTASNENQIVDYYTVDNVGNQTTGSFTVTNIDKTPPSSGSANQDVSFWTSGDVVVFVNQGDDNGSGVSNVWCKKQEDQDYLPGAGGVCDITASSEGQVIDYYTEDNVGNKEYGSHTVTNIDKTPPTPGSADQNINAWTNTDVVVTVSKGTDNGVGAVNVFCKTEIDQDFSPGNGNTCAVTMTGNGNVLYYTVDDLGHVSSTMSYPVGNIDKVLPPQVPNAAENTGAISGQTESNVFAPNFTWNEVSDTSGIDTYNIYWGTDPNGSSAVYSSSSPTFSPSVVDEIGTYYLRLNTVDVAGNESGWNTVFEFVYSVDGEFALVDPTTGGELATTNGSLNVVFGASAVSDTTRVTYVRGETQPVEASPVNVLDTFSLNALDTTGGDVTDFSSNPYILTYTYPAEQEAYFIESTLKLYYYNEPSGEWVEVPADLDTTNNTITATIDHFTDFSVQGESFFGSGFAVINLGPGSLSISAQVIDFAYDINGNPVTHQVLGSVFDTETRSNNWETSDASGTGAGWTVSVRTTGFSDPSPTNDYVIPAENMMVKIDNTTISKVYSNSSGVPFSSSEVYIVMDDTTSVVILSAVGPDGMGTYSFSPDFKLTIPAEVKQGSYSAVVTVDIQSTP